MTAILLRTIRHEFFPAGSAFRAFGIPAHMPVLMPPEQTAGVRTELLLFPAGRMLQRIAALPACVFFRHCYLTDRL